MTKRLVVLAVLLSLVAVSLSAQIYNAPTPAPGSPGRPGTATESPRQPGPPRSARQYYDRARGYADRRDWERARDDLLRAIEIEDDFVDALLLIGRVYREMNDYDRSLQYYQRATRYRSGIEEAHYAIGELALDRDNVTLAVRQYLFLRDGGSRLADDLWASIERYVRRRT